MNIYIFKKVKDDNEEALEEVLVNKDSNCESKITKQFQISEHCSRKCEIGHRKSVPRKGKALSHVSLPVKIHLYVYTSHHPMTGSMTNSTVNIRIKQHQEKHASSHIDFPSDTPAQNDTKVSEEKLKENDASPDIVTGMSDTSLDPLAVQNAAVEDNATVQCTLSHFLGSYHPN